MKKFVTISSVKTKTLSLVEKHIDELKDIDVVVGMSRAGMIPAALVAMKLDIPLILMYKDGDYYATDRAISSGEKILLVDDICRTGKTIFGATMALKHFTEGENIKLMTVFDVTSIDKTVYPHMTNKTVEDIKFPWDYE